MWVQGFWQGLGLARWFYSLLLCSRISKFQAPTSNIQRSSKHQCSNVGNRSRLWGEEELAALRCAEKITLADFRGLQQDTVEEERLRRVGDCDTPGERARGRFEGHSETVAALVDQVVPGVNRDEIRDAFSQISATEYDTAVCEIEYAS